MNFYLRLLDSLSSIQQAIADQAIDQWRIRLRACIRETGGHFEHLLLGFDIALFVRAFRYDVSFKRASR